MQAHWRMGVGFAGTILSMAAVVSRGDEGGAGAEDAITGLETFSSVCERDAEPIEPIGADDLTTPPMQPTAAESFAGRVWRYWHAVSRCARLTPTDETSAPADEGSDWAVAAALNAARERVDEPGLLSIDESECKEDVALGDLQRRYRELVAEQRWDEARDVADEIVDAAAIEFAGRGAPATPTRHRVGYPPIDANVRTAAFATSDGHTDAHAWNDVADRRITFDFQGVGINDACQFFRLGAGWTFVVDPSAAALAGDRKIHAMCRDRTIIEGLRVALGSVGLGYVVEGDVVTVAAPDEVRRRARASSQVVDAWTP